MQLALPSSLIAIPSFPTPSTKKCNWLLAVSFWLFALRFWLFSHRSSLIAISSFHLCFELLTK